MIYNSYFTNIITRISFLLVTLTGLSYLILQADRFFSIIFLVILVVLQVLALLSFLNRTNRNLARFLLLLTEEETSVIAWKDRVERTFKGLHHSFKQVNEEISRIKLEKEKGAILLRNLINHINSGILAVQESGDVLEINAAALRIFGIVKLDNLADLNQIQQGFSARLENLKYDSGNILEFAGSDPMPVSLLVKVSMVKLEDRTIRIYSIQSIGSQLEAREIEAWQKLTRILSHEISNSVTPISTLGEGIQMKLAKGSHDLDGSLVLSKEIARDLVQSSQLLQKRCDAMVDFMEHYKSYTRLPDPVSESIEIRILFENLTRYFVEELKQKKISILTEINGESLFIRADPKLLDQALINLIRNSIDTLEKTNEGVIKLRARSGGEGLVVIEISDNGPGIEPDIQSQVFIPFFTTKPGGTGIGLSIVKKIILLSGGTIRFISEPGTGTNFYMELPADT